MHHVAFVHEANDDRLAEGGDDWGRGRKPPEGKPEQQVQVRPQNAATNGSDGLEQMVMIVPVDAHVHEAEHVAHEDRAKALQVLEARSVGRNEFQDHDRDDDRDDAVAERLEAALVYLVPRSHVRSLALPDTPLVHHDGLRQCTMRPIRRIRMPSSWARVLWRPSALQVAHLCCGPAGL